jgi:hypothetical protein
MQGKSTLQLCSDPLMWLYMLGGRIIHFTQVLRSLSPRQDYHIMIYFLLSYLEYVRLPDGTTVLEHTSYVQHQKTTVVVYLSSLYYILARSEQFWVQPIFVPGQLNFLQSH